MSDRPPWAHAYYARRTVQALLLLAERPRSAPELAEELQVAAPSALRLIASLVAGGLVEEDPDSLRHRHRIAPGGYGLGLKLVAAGLRELERREREALAVGRLLSRYRQREIDEHQVLEFASRLGVDVLDLLTLRRTTAPRTSD